jgi:hypothetical protein
VDAFATATNAVIRPASGPIIPFIAGVSFIAVTSEQSRRFLFTAARQEETNGEKHTWMLGYYERHHLLVQTTLQARRASILSTLGTTQWSLADHGVVKGQ